MDIGAQYLARGLGNAGANLGAGIAQWKERRRQAKETDAAFGAVGTAVEHLVKQGALPEGVLGQYAKMAEGTVEQKRGFLQGLGSTLGMVNQAQEQQLRLKDFTAREEDRAADNRRADSHLKLQEGFAKDATAKQAREREAMIGFGEFLRGPEGQDPTAMLRYFSEKGMEPPVGLRHFVPEKESSPFEPRLVDLGGGVTAMTTSRGSAVPVIKPSTTKHTTENYQFIFSDDPEEFQQGLESLPAADVKEALARRAAWNRATGRNVDPLKQAIGRLMGGEPLKDQQPSAGEKATPTKGSMRRFDGRGKPLD